MLRVENFRVVFWQVTVVVIEYVVVVAAVEVASFGVVELLRVKLNRKSKREQ